MNKKTAGIMHRTYKRMEEVDDLNAKMHLVKRSYYAGDISDKELIKEYEKLLQEYKQLMMKYETKLWHTEFDWAYIRDKNEQCIPKFMRPFVLRK